jgi:hypothetical protein
MSGRCLYFGGGWWALARDDEFADFVAARYRALVRTGFGLTGDLGHAEDLAQSALIRTYLSWGRLRDPANAEAYARQTLVRLALRGRQRRWHGEISSAPMPEPASLIPGNEPLFVWTGRAIIAVNLGAIVDGPGVRIRPDDMAMYNPAIKRWFRLAAAPGRPAVSDAPVWTGTELLTLTDAGRLLAFRR